MLRCSARLVAPARLAPAHLAPARALARQADDLTPMSIADRVEAAAAKSGALRGLSGEGKPLSNDPDSSQVHVAKLSRNMEARAEAEMQQYSRSGLLRDLAGEGEPLPETHLRTSGTSQSSIQSHVQKETLQKN